MKLLNKNSIKNMRMTLIVKRHDLIKTHDKFIMYNCKNDFQLTPKGIFGSWYYIIVEQIYTVIINSLVRLEDKLQ